MRDEQDQSGLGRTPRTRVGKAMKRARGAKSAAQLSAEQPATLGIGCRRQCWPSSTAVTGAACSPSRNCSRWLQQSTCRPRCCYSPAIPTARSNTCPAARHRAGRLTDRFCGQARTPGEGGGPSNLGVELVQANCANTTVRLPRWRTRKILPKEHRSAWVRRNRSATATARREERGSSELQREIEEENRRRATNYRRRSRRSERFGTAGWKNRCGDVPAYRRRRHQSQQTGKREQGAAG